jgi:beta-galactosidase
MGAAFLAAVLFMQSVGITAFAAGDEVTLNSESATQMASTSEIVYVNSYNDPSVRSQNFDSNWKFYLGDASGAENPTYDDSQWETLDLPHDYSIEQEYTESGEAESGYLPGGIGWYRKSFTLGEEMADKEIRLDFDGVYMNATVYVNGQQVGTHPYGYTAFSFDITDYVQIGKENTIAVKVNHQTPSSRWYSGSGIYRSVYLTTTDKLHVDLNGVKAETPNLSDRNADTTVLTTIQNETSEAKTVTITHTVFAKGQSVESAIGTVTTGEQEIAAGSSADISVTIPVN